MRLGALLAVGVLQFAPGWAHACLFLRSVEPAQWYEWSSALFAGKVTSVEENGARRMDVIGLRVVETFKGPAGESAKVDIPSRFWAACKLERPAVGASVLVAMHAGGDVQLVPLTADYATQLRALRVR
jgi:hypothetical protein